MTRCRGSVDGRDDERRQRWRSAIEFAPRQHETEQITAHVLWMTTGLSCEGDSVAMTSATNPSLEDIIQGVIPGMPRVVIHNQVIAFEVGDEYIQAWYDAEQGKLDPFVLVIEGSVGNEQINGEGHWTGFGVNPANGQPITLNEWIDRLAPKAAAVVAVGTCATYGGIPAMKNNPTGAMGVPDYLGWKWRSKAEPAGRLHPRLPGPAGQHDRGADVPRLPPRRDGAGARARRAAAAEVAVRADRARGLQPRRLHRAGQLRDRVRLGPPLPRQARLQGAGGQVQRARSAAGSTASAAARTSAASAWPARCPASPTSTCRSWTRTRGASAAATFQRFTYGPVFRYFRKRNLEKKFDIEPEWRRRGRRSPAATRSAGSAAHRSDSAPTFTGETRWQQ